MGSQFVPANKIILDFLKDSKTKTYFETIGVKSPKFEHYFKGCSKLGSLIESCVKITKRLINKTVKNNVLDLREFEFLIEEALTIINKRPISFRESLRDCSNDSIPAPITPEILIHGFELNSVNIIPKLHIVDVTEFTDPSYEPSRKIRQTFNKLNSVRKNLYETYKNEFYSNLLIQATDKKDRYFPIKHQKLKIGDIVLLKDEYKKALHYPMARIIKVYSNDLEEITNVEVLKGSTREIVKRHISSIVPLLTYEETNYN